MASGDIDPRLTEFVAFLTRDPSQQNFLKLADILSRIFPTDSYSSKRRARLAALRSSFSSNNVSREKLQWLPEHLLEMVPRTPRDHSSSADGRNNRDVSEHNLSNTSPSRSVAPDATAGGRVRASDGHQHIESQPDDHDQTNNDANTPSSTENPYGRQPGSTSSRHELRHGHSYATLPPLQLGDHTATHSGPGPLRHRVSPMEPHVAMNPPSAHWGNAPVAPVHPPAPPPTAAGSTRPLGFRYTPAEYNARRPASAYSHDHVATLTSSGGSVTSSEPLPTPNSSHSGHGLLWTHARHDDAQPVAERANCDVSAAPPPPGDGFRFVPSLTSADYAGSMPPPPPPRGATTRARAHALSVTSAAATSGTVAMYTDGVLEDDDGPDVDEGSDEGESGEEGQDLEGAGAGGPGVAVGTIGTGRVSRPGGQPDVSDEHRAAITAVPPRNFTMTEIQDMVDFFFEPRADRRRADAAMLPGTASTAIFKELSRVKFYNSRPPSALRTQHKNLLHTFQELSEFGGHFSLDFTSHGNEDDLLRLLRHQLNQLAAQGIKFPHLNPWKILVFVRKHWYHWMRVAIKDHPVVQTSTDFHDGMVSPPLPPPPPLHPGLPHPAARSSTLPHLRAPSLHSRAPSSHSHAPSSHSRAPSSHSRAPSSHSHAASSHSHTPSRAATQSRAPTQPPMSSRLDVRLPTQSQAPPPSTAGSSRGSKKKQPPSAPPANPTIHAPPAPPSSISVPRATSASSSSLLRIPRDSASARQARRAAPTSGSGNTRLSRHSRASGQGSGTAPFTAGVGSSAHSRTTESSFDSEVPGGAEMVRQQRIYLDGELEISREDSEHARLFHQIQVQIARQMAHLNARATRQTMRMEREGAALGRVTARVQHAAAQASMIANAATTIGPQHPRMSGQLVAQPPSLGTFDEMLMEARQEVDEEMGPLDEDEGEDEDGESPLSPPQPQLFTRGLLTSLAYPQAPFSPRSGPSNYQAQLRDEAAMSSRFEDMGTVVGSPREGASEDLMEVESLSIEGNGHEAEADLEYVDLPPRPPR